MPIYEYRCRKCGRTAEILAPTMSDPEPPRCPNCGEEMERRISSPAVVTSKSHDSGHTCCGREERCDKPPCSGGGHCRRH